MCVRVCVVESGNSVEINIRLYRSSEPENGMLSNVVLAEPQAKLKTGFVSKRGKRGLRCVDVGVAAY